MSLSLSSFASSFVLLAVVVSLGVSGAGPANADDRRQERAEISKMANDTLGRLYRFQPSARRLVAGSSGYAVFANFGMKILVLGGGRGRGVVIDRKTGKRTYMKMLEAQAGLGLGIKKFRLVWVFTNRRALQRFVTNGWEMSGQFTAAAKTADKGGATAGAIAVSDGVWVYQLTDKGLALDLTLKATKYYPYSDLNR